jgi:hypothetical protein
MVAIRLGSEGAVSGANLKDKADKDVAGPVTLNDRSRIELREETGRCRRVADRVKEVDDRRAEQQSP